MLNYLIATSGFTPKALPEALLECDRIGYAMIDGWIRRRVAWYLRREEVSAWQSMREGKCNRCGKCCRGCPAHDASGNRCRIYAHRPDICREFPLTPEDIQHIKNCGYKFNKQSKL
ncbi:MAG: hypothetical protein GKC10_09345 [Methanosarcinales archaeon]|nr:hypothetical protein [Methanosarcinales archaeon]